MQTEYNPEKFQKTIEKWKCQRSNYPGWVVLPRDKRHKLWLQTKEYHDYISNQNFKIEIFDDSSLALNLAFELLWRVERCLFPLTEKFASFLEKIENQFPKEKESILLKKNPVRYEESFSYVTEIRLRLLRYYREEGLRKKWQYLFGILNESEAIDLTEQRFRLIHEEVLQAIFTFDQSKARHLLVNWKFNAPPYWEVKRAALLAEIGEVELAQNILEVNLKKIRKQLRLSPVIDDFKLISQESIIMSILQFVNYAIKPLGENFTTEFSERQGEFSKYKCDPINEIETLSAKFKNTDGWKQISKTHVFDIGYSKNTFHFGPDNTTISAFGFLQMYEDLGLPYRIKNITYHSKALAETLPFVNPHSPHLAFVNFVRLGSKEYADKLFDREALENLSINKVDELIQTYLPPFETMISNLDRLDKSELVQYESMATTFPEVFSRLCSKCSPDSRKKFVHVLRLIYNSNHKKMFNTANKFTERLVKSMSLEERINIVPDLISFPAQEHSHLSLKHPLIDVYLPDSVRIGKNVVSDEVIKKLFDQVKNDKNSTMGKWAMVTLVWLYWQDRLNIRQTNLLGKVLWDGVEESELPQVSGFIKTISLTLPNPEKIDPVERYKKNLLFNEKKLDLINELGELSYAVQNCKWSKHEVIKLINLFLDWKNENELSLLVPPFFDNPLEKIMRFEGLISNLIIKLPSASYSIEEIKVLKKFLDALNDVQTLEFEAATINIFPEKQSKVFERISKNLLKKDHDIVGDALCATLVLANLSKEKNKWAFNMVGKNLVAGVKWRFRPALISRLNVINQLVKMKHWFLDSMVLSDIYIGLDEIALETSTGVKGNDEDGLIQIRIAAASLAYSLFKHNKDLGLNNPTIDLWNKICHDSNEFSEVKNSWLNI